MAVGTNLDHYQKESRFHHSLGKPIAELSVDTLYAYQLGVLTAARAAHGVTNVWQGVDVIPLDDNDEIHALWVAPHTLNPKFPIKIRWGLLPNNATSAITLTTTIDRVDMLATAKGSDVAADGATALDTTISAVVAADTTANTPMFSTWGVLNGPSASTTRTDALFVKLVASGASAADRMRIFCMQVAYRTYAAQ